MTKQQYSLKITTEYTMLNRVIPFNWRPSAAEVMESIRRLRSQAKTDGHDLVKIEAVTLSKTETINSFPIIMSTVNEDRVF